MCILHSFQDIYLHSILVPNSQCMYSTAYSTHHNNLQFNILIPLDDFRTENHLANLNLERISCNSINVMSGVLCNFQSTDNKQTLTKTLQSKAQCLMHRSSIPWLYIYTSDITHTHTTHALNTQSPAILLHRSPQSLGKDVQAPAVFRAACSIFSHASSIFLKLVGVSTLYYSVFTYFEQERGRGRKDRTSKTDKMACRGKDAGRSGCRRGSWVIGVSGIVFRGVWASGYLLVFHV